MTILVRTSKKGNYVIRGKGPLQSFPLDYTADDQDDSFSRRGLLLLVLDDSSEEPEIAS